MDAFVVIPAVTGSPKLGQSSGLGKLHGKVFLLERELDMGLVTKAGKLFGG